MLLSVKQGHPGSILSQIEILQKKLEEAKEQTKHLKNELEKKNTSQGGKKKKRREQYLSIFCFSAQAYRWAQPRESAAVIYRVRYLVGWASLLTAVRSAKGQIRTQTTGSSRRQL